MKSCSHIFALITACVFLFCGCSNYLSLSKASSVPYPQTEYDTALKAYRDSLEMPLSPVDAEHGEDAPIVWEDTGMEAAVRLLLNRPEGTINRSDVWDLSTLTITERTMFEGDSGTTTIVTVTAQQGDATLEQEISAVGKESPLPALASLHDLQYFDRLQAFSYSTSPTANQAFTDFSGIETMSHLERFSVNGARPETLEPLSHLSQLPDLVCLNLTNHTRVTTKFCKQILAHSPDLRFLNIQNTPASEGSALDVEYLRAYTEADLLKRLANKLRNTFG